MAVGCWDPFSSSTASFRALVLPARDADDLTMGLVLAKDPDRAIDRVDTLSGKTGATDERRLRVRLPELPILAGVEQTEFEVLETAELTDPSPKIDKDPVDSVETASTRSKWSADVGVAITVFPASGDGRCKIGLLCKWYMLMTAHSLLIR